MDNDIDKSLVFINSPIDSISDDIIGFSAHADKLQAAIASGAKMIAVTSPFGSGKSSLSKILEKNLEEHSEYQCIRLSLWPQLLSSKNKSDESDTNTYEATDLHRYFLYQVVSKVNRRHATYVGKKLNGNYGLLKFHIDGIGSTILFLIAAFLFIASFIIGKFTDANTEILKWSAKSLSDFTLIASLALFVISIWSSEILFSSRKSEGQRVSTSTDIVELFKKYVLNHNAVDHYIIIIEDLDRTDNNDLVVTFLKELRKYYIEDENGKITFIVNIKPESFIHNKFAEHELGSGETLYSKLFDYTLNLQSINIMDYDAILSSLLQQKEAQIKTLLDVKSVSLADIPEIEWIIRGDELSIRTIKDRLNRAFALYESLKAKFSDSPVDFKKCAAASYLTTAYEKDFYATDHEAFGHLSEALIRNDLDSQIDSLLPGCSDEYKSAVKELIQAHLIDDEYHKYYYNYPREGRIYYSDELVVKSAILFGTAPDNLIQMTERSLARDSSIFEESFARLMRLGIPIPDAVMENELLYIEALRYYSEGVYEWIRNLDYKEESTPVTVKKILNLLSFDINRSVYSSIHAKNYSEIWSKSFHESALLYLREKLCNQFPQEITWYKILFEHPHTVIKESEINCISLSDAVSLVDMNCDTFDVSTIGYILSRFRTVWPDSSSKASIENLIRRSSELDSPVATVNEFLDFMDIAVCIPQDFERAIVLKAHSDFNVFTRYQDIINKIDVSMLSSETLNNICGLDQYDGYSKELSDRLYIESYIYASTLIRVSGDYPVDYADAKTCDALALNIDNLTTHGELFKKLRISIIAQKSSTLVKRYTFLFGPNCPVASQHELYSLSDSISDNEILKLLPPEIITEDDLSYIVSFLNRKWHRNGEAAGIIGQIVKWEPELAEKAFYMLDFNAAFKYDTFSGERQRIIRKSYTNILALSTVESRIQFMNSTHWIDSTFDATASSDIGSNKDLQQAYIDTVNTANIRSITKTTISNICDFSSIYALALPVCEKLYKAGKHKYYVASKTLKMRRFEMDSEEKIEELWPTYIAIFSSNSGYNTTRSYMAQNTAFLEEIIRRGSYVDMPESSRMELSKVNQSAECIRDAVTYENEFVLEYFSQIVGFLDWNAASEFVRIVEQHPLILASDRVYSNTHQKLINPQLKARYTRLRKKNTH